MRHRLSVAFFMAALAATGLCGAQTLAVPNPSFEEGAANAPARWSLSGGQGAWVEGGTDGQHAVTVTGTATDSNYWLSESLPLRPSAVYRLKFDVRRMDERQGEGTPITGPIFCNRDLDAIAAEWTPYTSIFVAPRDVSPESARLRLGQWQRPGVVAFDNVSLVQIQPVYAQKGVFVLGEGERVHGNEYEFKAPYYSDSSNQSRPLVDYQCQFNTYRWVLTDGNDVIYRHQIGDRRQTGASVEVNICYYEGSELVLEAARDGKTWREFGTLHEKVSRTFAIPSDLFPAAEIWVRLRARAAAKPGAFQIDAYAYRAKLDGQSAQATGATRFVAVTGSDPRLHVTVDSLGDAVPGGDNTLVARVANVSGQPVVLHPNLSFEPAAGTAGSQPLEVTAPPGEQTLRVPYTAPNAGAYIARLTLGPGITYAAETSIYVSYICDASYGERLPASTNDVAVWWASSGWKIGQTRPAPEAAGSALEIRAAANETEAAQLVVRPAKPLRGFTARVTALNGPDGKAIPAERVEILRVRYVSVTQPTDRIGAVAPWPDPLPPIKAPLELASGCNQPLWVRVSVPKDTPAGTFTGTLQLAAENYTAEVPLRVIVYGFSMPDRMTCTSAFGFSPSRVFEYQKLSTPEQQRAVLDKYLADYGAHHIAPYNPAPLDPFNVTWPASAWEGGGRDRAEKHGGQSSLLLDDSSTTSNVASAYTRDLPIPEKGFVLRFAYKTKTPGHPFIVTLAHLDVGGHWMNGRNNDIRVEGNGQWQAFERPIAQFPEGAKSVRFTLRPTLWSEAGSETGTVWFDDVSIQDAGTGTELLAGGDFEPLQSKDLSPAFDWAAWDAAMTKAFDQYHFNTFSLPIQGMGGGTFASRVDPTLLGYRDDAPEYKTAFTLYCRAVQEHLRGKGWLKDAFVYWFDEPEPRDYPFVMNGFRKLKEAAPDIPRMLTEQVEPELAGGPNIWCPLSPAYNPERAEQRRAAGDHFWWYVCCGPKEPYCGLFIDHPGAELRVWLWQTWQRRIEGILIWETTWWSSGAAYPDPAHPQNPYEDPMGWTEGYGVPAGARLAWGNGDGRFVYPPEAAADAHPAGPILEGPVDSIRWEMLRDGIEDYEYLVILNRLLEQRGARLSVERRAAYAALTEVPASITADLTTFTKDPKPIEERRDAVARAIEELSRL